jgi:hypothetical protein
VCLLLESESEAPSLDAVFTDATRGDPPSGSNLDAFLLLAGDR